MLHEYSDYRSVRRTFLKSIGVLGLSATGASAAAAEESAESLDEYHQGLRDELTDPSRQQRQLPAGSYVYGTTEQATIDAFSLRGGRTETAISVDTDAVPIMRAERLDVPTVREDPSDYTYRGDLTDHSFSQGDLLLAVAYVRSDSDEAEANAGFRYRYTDSDGDTASSENFVQRGAHIEPNGKWMRYYFPIEVGAKPDGSDLTPAFEFWIGYADQTLDFGGIVLFEYDNSEVSLETFPPYDYEGRAADAAWHEDARDRINETRKTDIEVTVLNPGGQPMPSATVDVKMTEHEFDFGSAVSVGHVTGNSEDDETYRETFLDNFNKAVVENGMKYPAWENTEGWDIDNDATQATLDWLNERNIPTRGHYLLWEQFDASGGGGMNVNSNLSPDEIEQQISEKIREHANEFDNRVIEWDIHNHPIWQSNFRDMEELGWDAVREWWSAANEATDDELYTNEMGVVGGIWQRSQYYDYVSHLVENDYPIDGIGFMGHHQKRNNQLLDVKNIIEGFDMFSEFGLPILVTEFDIQIFDRRNAQEVKVQTDYLRDFLTVAFSMEAVEGIVSWSFWEDDHWRPTGAYYDSDWRLRPHGEKFRELVFEEWWSDDTGETNEDGVYITRGFKGSYRVTAKKGALSGETTVTFDDENGSVTVELAPPSESDSNGYN